MSIYYVYFYLRSEDSKTAKQGTPYYIGKGKNKRITEKHHKIPIPKDKSKIILVEQNLTELQAFILERYYIRWFGRKDLGTGILLNKTNGGEGVSGIVQSKLSIQKRIKSNTGKTRSEQSKLNISISRKGVPSSVKKGDKRNSSTKEKIAKKCIERVKNGNHNLQKRKDGTSLTSDRAKKGKHNFQKRKDGTSLASDRVKAGTNPFQQHKNSVPCYNKEGLYKRISKDYYHSQKGQMENWEWVFNRSKEGEKRKINV